MCVARRIPIEYDSISIEFIYTQIYDTTPTWARPHSAGVPKSKLAIIHKPNIGDIG